MGTLRIAFLLIGLVGFGAFPACGQIPEAEPERVFEDLWQTFDRRYALFECKGIDWQALYDVYRPRVHGEMSEGELFDVLSSLLEHLNDNHVSLRGAGRRFQSGILGQANPEVFALELILESYLRDVRSHAGGAFHSGWLAQGIGYVHIRHFESYGGSGPAMDAILERFRPARGLVVDVRHNGGGSDREGQVVAGRFAEEPRPYMESRARNGAEPDDFEAPRTWVVEPRGDIRFTGPVVVLQNRFTVSAAENFVLAMRTLPQVTTVGETTSGAFADVTSHRLPNRWRVSISWKLFTDARGRCWEGVGIPPHLRVVATPEQIASGRDRALEFAQSLLTTLTVAEPGPGKSPKAGGSSTRPSPPEPRPRPRQRG